MSQRFYTQNYYILTVCTLVKAAVVICGPCSLFLSMDIYFLFLQGLKEKQWKGEVTHLTCPVPESFSFLQERASKSSMRDMWKPSFEQSKKEAQALRLLVDRNKNFTTQDFWNLVFKH